MIVARLAEVFDHHWWHKDSRHEVQAMVYPRELLEEQEAMIVRELGRGLSNRARAMLEVVHNFWFTHNYGYRWLELDRQLQPSDDDSWTAEDYLRSAG
jgi:hypothetical protein